jgi:hypothetical protein
MFSSSESLFSAHCFYPLNGNLVASQNLRSDPGFSSNSPQDSFIIKTYFFKLAPPNRFRSRLSLTPRLLELLADELNSVRLIFGEDTTFFIALDEAQCLTHRYNGYFLSKLRATCSSMHDPQPRGDLVGCDSEYHHLSIDAVI